VKAQSMLSRVSRTIVPAVEDACLALFGGAMGKIE